MGSQDAYNTLELLEKEKVELKSSWTDDFNELYEIGSQIYFRVFQTCPETQKLFPFENKHKVSEPNDQNSIKNEKVFRAQALKFVQVLSRAANAYSVGGIRAQEFDIFLIQLGRKHQEYKDRGFQPKYWDIFQKSLMEVMTERIKAHYGSMHDPNSSPTSRKSFSEELRVGLRAWEKLSSHIVRKMNYGFLHQSEIVD